MSDMPVWEYPLECMPAVLSHHTGMTATDSYGVRELLWTIDMALGGLELWDIGGIAAGLERLRMFGQRSDAG